MKDPPVGLQRKNAEKRAECGADQLQQNPRGL